VADDCDLNFETHLANPDPEQVEKVAVGDKLAVVLDEEGPSIRAERAGARVGSIADRVPTLVNCIRAGNQYEAEVEAAEGGDVKVTVRKTVA
jgi:hypothetical protein